MNEYAYSKFDPLSLPSREVRRDMASSKINGNRSMSRGDLHYLFTYDSLSEMLRKVAQNSETLHDAAFRHRYLNAALRENHANDDSYEANARDANYAGTRNADDADTRNAHKAGTRNSYKLNTFTYNAMFRSRDRNIALREMCANSLNSHLTENLVEPSGQYEIP